MLNSAKYKEKSKQLVSLLSEANFAGVIPSSQVIGSYTEQLAVILLSEADYSSTCIKRQTSGSVESPPS